MSMSTPAGAWQRFFHAPSSGLRMAGVRVLLGLYLLAYLGGMAPHVTLMFSRQGVYVPYLLPDYAPAPAVAFIVFGALLAATLALTAGYRTALSAPLVLGLFLYHYFLQIAVKQSSFDRLIAIYLIALCFADAGRVLGLDALRPGGRPTRWGERIVQIQTVSLYLGAALWKVVNPAWHSGELLRSNLLGMWATPLAFEFVRLDFSQRTWAIFSQSIIALEAAIGVLLLVPRARALGLLLGLGFHIGNCVVLVIPEFLVAVAAYPAFMRESTLARIAAAASRAVARLTRRTSRANAA
jgi:hypothetical protein